MFDKLIERKGVKLSFFAFVMSVTFQMAVVQGASATVYQLPGLGPSDPTDYGPVFLTDVSVKFKNSKKGASLTARSHGDTFSFVMGGVSYDVTKGKYYLNADFDAGGNLVGGSVDISGSIADMGIDGGLLATMSLVDFAWSDSLLGFNTADLVCPQFDFCTSAESVYLAEFGGGFDFDAKHWKGSSLAITTVPLPAAAWLFGSALLGLGGMVRRRRA